MWNDALSIYKEAHQLGLPRPCDVDKRCITQAKKTEQRAWLSEVSNIVLQQSYRDLQQAWNNYFSSRKGGRKGRSVGCPRFKKRQSRQTMRLTVGGFSVHSCSVKLAKIGHIRMVVSRRLPSKPSSVTIIKDTIGRFFASFVVEVMPEILPVATGSVGIDLGLNHFAILSNGEKVENPKLHNKQRKRIKKASRKLSKCKKGSNRRQKAKLKLARCHAKVKDSRTDFLHKLTTRLVRENQAIAVEDLNVSGLVKNRKLSRAISDAGWYSFRTLLDGKCQKYGRAFIVINRWTPTSQRCSACGESGGKKKLDVREWQCLYCGVIHDRDVNAAINIKDAGGLSESLNGRWSDCKTVSGQQFASSVAGGSFPPQTLG